MGRDRERGREDKRGVDKKTDKRGRSPPPPPRHSTRETESEIKSKAKKKRERSPPPAPEKVQPEHSMLPSDDESSDDSDDDETMLFGFDSRLESLFLLFSIVV